MGFKVMGCWSWYFTIKARNVMPKKPKYTEESSISGPL